jgi:hypothetical protein
MAVNLPLEEVSVEGKLQLQEAMGRQPLAA